jgi:TRAP-type C4-dicarboxylate transport system substrate-binding protein
LQRYITETRVAIMKRLTIIASVIILLTAIHTERADAQRAATAVMEVRVEVVAGATVSRNDIATVFAPDANEITYGEFSLFVPNGGELLAQSAESIEMKNGDYSWTMASKMDIERSDCGNLRLLFTSAGNPEIRNGIHKGVQVAVIEYL